MPGLRFFSKMKSSDIFIYLDDVQYEKREFQNRNKIKTSDGPQYITVPVITKSKFNQKILEVEISQYKQMALEHLKKIRFNYSRAPYFNVLFPEIEKIYFEDHKKLSELSMSFINLFRKQLGINSLYRFSSEFNLSSYSSLRLAELCIKVGADRYLSGIGGKNYLEMNPFEERGIKVMWQDFKIKPYPQLYGDFLPDLSILDLIMNCGKKAVDYL